jgi:hypothetical protein
MDKKDLTMDFSSEIIDIMNNMSFTDGQNVSIVGTGSLRSQLYSSDFDFMEAVENKKGETINEYLKFLKKKFQTIIKRLLKMELVYIGDIKCGSVPEWQVIDEDIKKYSQSKSIKILDNLLNDKVINSKEYEEKMKLLKPSINILEFLFLKDEFKYHIIRWTPKEILNGYKTLDDGSKYDLENGFKTPSNTKLDVIGWIYGNRFCDFSMIYQFNFNGKPINGINLNSEEGIKQDIIYLLNEKEYFKMAKRIFSIARRTDDEKVMGILSNLFNSELGIIYQIINDIKTLEYLIENNDVLPIERIHFEEDHFKNRLSNVTIPSLLSQKKTINSLINRLEKTTSKNKSLTLKELDELKNILEKILNNTTEIYLKNIRFLPLPKELLL